MMRSQLHSQMNRLYADIAKRNADLLAQTRMYSTRVPVAGYDLAVDPLDDIQKDCMRRADDMVDALRYTIFPADQRYSSGADFRVTYPVVVT